MKKIIKWLKSPWGISLGTAIISFFLTIGYDFLKDKPVFSTIGSIFIAIWNFIIALLSFELKVWWVLLGIALIVFIIYILYKIDSVKNSEANSPPFLKYTKDTINGWRWEWIWEKQYNGKWGIENLHPICSNCETPLVRSYEHGGRLVCLRCNKELYGVLPNLEHVEMLLYDNVKRDLLDRGDAT